VTVAARCRGVLTAGSLRDGTLALARSLEALGLGANRGWDLLTAEQGPVPPWPAVVVASVRSADVGLTAGAAAYASAVKERREMLQADAAPATAVTAEDVRDTLVGALWLAADTQRKLVATTLAAGRDTAASVETAGASSRPSWS
jgi:hypothetical protein